MSLLLGDSGHLLTCEARTPFSSVLRYNIAGNRLTNVTLVDWPAVAAGADERNLDDPPEGRIDGMELERLDLLMLGDCAHALEWLQGCDATLWRLRPRVHVVAESESQGGAVAMQLKTFGYRCWTYAVPLYNPDNFNRRDDDRTQGGYAYGIVGIPEEHDVAVQIDACKEI